MTISRVVSNKCPGQVGPIILGPRGPWAYIMHIFKSTSSKHEKQCSCESSGYFFQNRQKPAFDLLVLPYSVSKMANKYGPGAFILDTSKIIFNGLNSNFHGNPVGTLCKIAKHHLSLFWSYSGSSRTQIYGASGTHFYTRLKVIPVSLINKYSVNAAETCCKIDEKRTFYLLLLYSG